MAVSSRVDQFRALARQAINDLFDQDHPFGRLALVQVFMIAGDTLVTISLAGSLFFSISPTEAKSKVLLYLLLTLAPFAVVSPFMGPLIDRSRGARRAMVVLSAVGRAGLCLLMARDIHSLLLFPEAFFILVLSKVYLVTRGALVPEMVRAADLLSTDGRVTGSDAGERQADQLVGEPLQHRPKAQHGPGPAPIGLAALNARLTLLGTLSGFVFSVPAIIIFKLAGAPGVLIFDALVFLAAAVAGFRLPVMRRWGPEAPVPSRGDLAAPDARSGTVRGAHVAVEAGRPDDRRTDDRGSGHRRDGSPPAHPAPADATTGDAGEDREVDPDLARLRPIAHPEVLLGLSTMSLIRGVAGFVVFFLAFGLRRLHAPLWWYGFALGASGIGALIGLVLLPRLLRRASEPQLLTGALVLIGAAAGAAAMVGDLGAQVALAFFVGVAGSIAQPSFDAMTQRYVPGPAQGRAFARFATRQQLVWVLGALVPVVVAFPLADGDLAIAVTVVVGAVLYHLGRRNLRLRVYAGHDTRFPVE